MGDKWKTSVNSCGRRHPSVRDKWETSVKSLDPRHLEWETSVGDKCKTSVNSGGPRHPVRDKCGRQVGDKCNHAAQDTQSEETSEKSWGQRHPEWETSVGDKCKLMRPKAPRGGDKCEGQVGDKCKLMRPKAPRVGDKCGRQVEDTCKLMRHKTPRVRRQV